MLLPAEQMETLRHIVIHLRRRAVVNEQWGFAERYARGLGLNALFGIYFELAPARERLPIEHALVDGELELAVRLRCEHGLWVPAAPSDPSNP